MINSPLRQLFQLLTLPLNLHLYIQKSEPELIFLLLTGTLTILFSLTFDISTSSFPLTVSHSVYYEHIYVFLTTTM